MDSDWLTKWSDLSEIEREEVVERISERVYATLMQTPEEICESDKMVRELSWKVQAKMSETSKGWIEYESYTENHDRRKLLSEEMLSRILDRWSSMYVGEKLDRRIRNIQISRECREGSPLKKIGEKYGLTYGAVYGITRKVMRVARWLLIRDARQRSTEQEKREQESCKD